MSTEVAVLVIDHDPYVADLIETYLVKRGYSVVKAHNADEAMATAIRVKPGAITLDVILEGTDGFDLLHMQGNGSRLTITNSLAYGNMGQQIKAGASGSATAAAVGV